MMKGDHNEDSENSSVIVQLHSEIGEATGPPLDVPLSINPKQLQLICNSLLENVSLLFYVRISSFQFEIFIMKVFQDEESPYAFYVNDSEILNTLDELVKSEKVSTEGTIKVVYQPQAVFKVSCLL